MYKNIQVTTGIIWISNDNYVALEMHASHNMWHIKLHGTVIMHYWPETQPYLYVYTTLNKFVGITSGLMR